MNDEANGRLFISEYPDNFHGRCLAEARSKGTIRARYCANFPSGSRQVNHDDEVNGRQAADQPPPAIIGGLTRHPAFLPSRLKKAAGPRIKSGETTRGSGGKHPSPAIAEPDARS